MPEKCLSCGEEAVIEDSVDGGKDQLICIECGTLADSNKVFKSSDFIEDDDDDLCEGNIEEESVTDATRYQSLLVPSVVECISCGVDFVSSNYCRVQGSDSSSSSSWKCQRLCSDCAECEGEEEKEGETTQGDKKGSTTEGLPVQRDDGVLEGCQTLHAVQTNESEPKCCSCGSGNLIMDSVNGDDRLICISCGQVNSDAILTSDSSYLDDIGTISTKYHKATLPTFAHRERVQEGLQVGLTEISNLCTKFCFQSNIKTETCDMYRRLYHHPKIKNISRRKKVHIAAVCLFVVCRRFDLPISATYFKPDVASFSLFLKMKSFLRKHLGLTLPHISFTRQLLDIVSRLKFDQQLLNKVKDILVLFTKAWLTQGKSRECLISLAAYYAYVSSDQCQKFLYWRQFFVKHKLAIMSRQLIKECQYTLCKLAGSLPWVKSKGVTPRELPRYIDSVLQYRESLFHLVFRPEENFVETFTCSTTPQTSLPCSKIPSNDTTSCGDGSHVATCQRRKRPLVPLSKKEYLLPWASKRRKGQETVVKEYCCPIPSDINLDSPILRESEFEEEISSYILSLEERERVREHKMVVFNSCV